MYILNREDANDKGARNTTVKESNEDIKSSAIASFAWIDSVHSSKTNMCPRSIQISIIHIPRSLHASRQKRIQYNS